MFKKSLQRWVSILLSLVLIFQMVPAQVFAHETNAEVNIIQTPVSSPEPVEIVAEIPEGRDEFQKEFLLSNGQRMISVYGTAVHYQENGQWKEIDNTLQPISSAGAVLTGKAALSSAVAYKNTAGVWDVTLPTSLNTSTPIEMSRDGYTLKFSFAGEIHNQHLIMSVGAENNLLSTAEAAATNNLQMENNADISGLIGSNRIEQVNTSAAQIIIENDRDNFDNSIYKETVLSKLSSAVEYTDIFNNTDLRYDLQSNKLKESVIINEPSQTLTGYTYTLETDGLVLELQEDNSILAYAQDKEDDEPIFCMPAPYLLDSALTHTGDIDVSLKEENGIYNLTYTLPRQWLLADEREYPVTLDPIVEALSGIYSIQDQSIFQYNQFSYTWGLLELGYDPGYGRERVFIKFNDIPELTSADVITNAKIHLTKYDSRSSVVMEAHEVKPYEDGSIWTSAGINWSNQPDHNANVEDYQIVSSAKPYTWNITDIVQKWYNTGKNTGVMFKLTNDIEDGPTRNYHYFYASDWGGSVIPTLDIFYLNNSGLESYWDYTSQSAGRAGTGYVNNFTGNLVWIHDDMSFSGNRMPVSISHVYNANDKNNNAFGMGCGWRTNYNQRVYQWAENSGYYIWEDQDGTLRYFARTSGSTYVNEIDSTLTLTTNGSGDEKYCITDKDGNKSYFDTDGRLKKISNNQATPSTISIAYDGSTDHITSVKDGANRVYAFTYTSNLLSKIVFMGSDNTERHSLTYEYDGSNLWKIKYPDNLTVTYGYTSNHLLTSATDVGGYKVAYEYTTTDSNVPNRIKKIAEYDGSTAGGHLEISYAHNETTFIDHNENKEIVQFNNYGSTVSIQDGQGRAQFAQYAGQSDAKSASQLTLSSKLIGTPDSAIATDGSPNLVNNGDFQNGTTGWVKNSSCTSDDTVSPAGSSAAPQLNASAYKIEGSATAEKKVYQTIAASGNTGDVFTLAGWAKGDSVPLYEGSDRRFGLAVKFIGADGTEGSEHLLSFNPDSNSEINWQYAATRVVADKAYSSIRVELLYCDNQNTAFFDGIQLYKEEFGQSYIYHEATGLVTSVIDMQKNQTTYEYESNQLTAIIENGTKTIAEYEYDDYNNVIKATAEDDTITYFAYDTYGNNTAVAVSDDPDLTFSTNEETGKLDSVTVASGKKAITSFADYTDDGNYLESVTDALGKQTFYGYNTQTGLLNWVQSPGESNTNRTNYDYDSLYRTTDVTKSASVVAYAYGCLHICAESCTDPCSHICSDTCDPDGADLLRAIVSASETQYTFTYGIFDLLQSVKVGTRTLISHEYNENDPNFYLTKSTYGNGHTISYTYDDYGRTTAKVYKDGAGDTTEDVVTYTYDNRGNLGLVTDSATGRTTKYLYDFQDRLSRYEELGSGYSSTVEWAYNTDNNLTSQTHILNGTTYTTEYSYDDHKRLIGNSQGSISSTYDYDVLGRMSAITSKNDGTQVIRTTIEYQNSNSNANTTSSQIARWTNRIGTTSGVNIHYLYTYDERGNILTLTYAGRTTRYTYDDLDQLIREDNQMKGKTWTYSYDKGGNILCKKEYDYTTVTGEAFDSIQPTNIIPYGYTDSAGWKDLLTSYDGQTLEYEPGIGNLKNDGIWEYTWEHGRQLSKMEKADDTSTIIYAYNADGMRISKNVDGVVYYYHYLGDQLVEMTWGSNKMRFIYDAIGPAALIYNGETYYYTRNAQGDVVGITNASGTNVVSYVYDAWGNVMSNSGTMADTLGTINPLRYRGYVYDTEAGLYYLQSRYYNPVWGRFINADTTAVLTVSPDSATWDKNLFAYCDNNPISRKDDGGEYWHIVIGAGLGVASQAIGDLLYARDNGISFWEIVKNNPGDYVQAAFSGAISAAIGNPFVAGSVNAVVGSGIKQLTNCIVYNDPWDWAEYGVDVFKTAVEEAVSFAVCPAVPNSISDIKVEARAYGVRGTNALKDYLTYKKIDAYCTNTVWGSVTTYVDHHIRRNAV